MTDDENKAEMDRRELHWFKVHRGWSPDPGTNIDAWLAEKREEDERLSELGYIHADCGECSYCRGTRYLRHPWVEANYPVNIYLQQNYFFEAVPHPLDKSAVCAAGRRYDRRISNGNHRTLTWECSSEFEAAKIKRALEDIGFSVELHYAMKEQPAAT